MRALIAIAIMTLGIGAAGAADLAAARGGRFVTHYQPVGRPAGQVVLYDWEPGVVVRPYWLPPWRDRHYFPFGRDRVVRTPWKAPRPAKSFHRYWSVSSAFELQPPRYWPQRRPLIDK